MPAPSATALKVLTARTGEKDTCEAYFYKLVLQTVDITLLHISRVYRVVFPRCQVAWTRGVLWCTREKTWTLCCTHSIVLATLCVSSPAG